VINLTDRLIASAGVRVDRFENKGTYKLDGDKDAQSHRLAKQAFRQN
jgi:iron complex outermembrane receptor protein